MAPCLHGPSALFPALWHTPAAQLRSTQSLDTAAPCRMWQRPTAGRILITITISSRSEQKLAECLCLCQPRMDSLRYALCQI